MMENGRDQSWKSSKSYSQFDTMKREMKTLAKIAFPVLLTNILHYAITLVTSIMTGRLPKTEYDALSLAISTLESYGIYLVGGFCTVCDTFFSQTIGSGDKKRTGLWLQKSFIIINLIMGVIVAVLLNCEIIFLLLGQDPTVSRLAAEFSTVMCSGIFFYGNYYILLRYLQNLDIIYPPVVINLVAVIFNAVSQYLCIYVFKLGFESISYCHSASYLLLLLQILAYIFITKLYRDTWDGFKRESLTAWGEFTAVSIGGAGQVTTENISYYLAVIIAGTMSATLLGAQNILYNIDTVLYMFPYAFGIAVNIRTGQALGKRNTAAAKLSFKVATFLSVMMTTLFGILLVIFQDFILRIFTKHEDIIEEAAKSIPFIATIIIVDGVRASTDGVFRGSGRQTTSALILLFAYYVVGLTIAIPLMLLTELELAGFWLGSLIGVAASLFISLAFLYYLDWDKEGEKAQKRVLLKKSIPTEKTSILSGSKKMSDFTTFESESYKENISNAMFHKLLVRRGFLLFGCLALIGISLVLRFTAFADLVNNWKPQNETFNETFVEAFNGEY